MNKIKEATITVKGIDIDGKDFEISWDQKGIEANTDNSKNNIEQLDKDFNIINGELKING